MEVAFGPNSVDEPNLLYKLQRKINVFNSTSPLSNRGYNLVASSSKYAIVFIASPDGVLSAYHLRDLIDKDCEPQHLSIQLQEKPTHIATSCDHELLAVTGGQLLCIFKISKLPNMKCAPSLVIKCDVNPSTFVSGLQWNPCIPDNIAIAFYDGSLFMASMSNAQVKKVPSKARCICWSPKGKQLVTGNSDGTLSQYKPDLTLAKTIPAPNLFEGFPVETLAVYWISTFQFAVVYRNAADNSRPAVAIINTPKGGQPSCMNYEDICYSMGSSRPWYYYLQGLAQWNIIMSASSNSMEIATLGSADGANWYQWCQSDEARPELPLTNKTVENFPVGVCIDTCAIHQLPWGENSTLPYMPLLHVVSQNGLLTIFNIINKAGAQVCSAPQALILPPAALTSNIPGEAPPQAVPAQAPAPASAPAPAPASAPAPVAQPKPQNIQPVQVVAPPQPQVAPPPQYTPLNIPKPILPHQATQGFSAEPVQLEQKPSLEIKPVPIPQTPRSAVPPPAAVKTPSTPQAQENAALKAEQERKNEIKVNEELKKMLIKEVNDFQKELYNFMVKTRETQAKLQRDIDSINANFSWNSMTAEQLKKECSLDELRGAIVQLKLELVRACAVVAEARTHAETKDCHQWTQADPLTAKRVASVKNLAYYVQTQLEQAQKSLDYKWTEAMAKVPSLKRPGGHMIRPVLDEVYQPLVKQQEILSRQQAVLRTLRNTLNECDVAPIFKSTSLLRSTPFKNKDPLSKLTKNILNMSIEPPKTKEPMLSAQKLDALRDMLLDHKTVIIKPVNVEMRQHLATMKMNYEKSLKEKAMKEQEVNRSTQPLIKTEPGIKLEKKPVIPQSMPLPKFEPKFEAKPEPTKKAPINIPSFTPVGGSSIKTSNNILGLNNVARTLFDDEPEPPKATSTPQVVQQPKPQPAFGFTNQTASTTTRSVLKDLLQSKQANIEAKNDANTFMGQTICSPSPFAKPVNTIPSSTPAPTSVFTAKPISDLNNMFSKFQTQTFDKTLFGSENKPVISFGEAKATGQNVTKVSASETGEPEPNETKTVTIKPKTAQQMTNLFGMKSATPPDVLKTTQDTKSDNKTVPKPAEKEKSKENVPDNTEVSGVIKTDKKETPKPFQTTNKTSIFSQQPVVSSTATVVPTKLSEIKPEAKVETPKAVEKTEATPLVSSIFSSSPATKPTTSEATVPKADTPQSEAVSTPKSVFSSASSAALDTAASIFGSAAASQPKPAPQTSQTSSIFATAVSSAPSSVFTSTQGSIFGSTATTTQASAFGTSSQSVFGNAETKPSIFSTPTPSSPTTPTTSTPSTPASVFSSGTTTTTTQAGSLFDSAAASSVFGSTTPSVFGTPAATTASSAFGASTATASSVFAGATSTSSTSIFGGTTVTQSAFTATTTQSVFGNSTSTAQSIFASAATTKPSVFGNSNTSVFGSPGGNQKPPSLFASTTQASVFGAAANNQTSVFGSPTPTTQTSIFGSATPTTQASIFGAATPTIQASVFGAATPTAPASVFGAATPTTQPSVFGASTPTAQPSVFGAATPTTQASVFGAPTPTTQASVFGAATPTTQASIFGSPPSTTAQSGSLFGGAEANLFASASISTTSAPSQTSGGSIFGGSPSGSVFGGGNTNVFGGKSTFGQSNQTAASIFGGGGASTFGQQKPANNFWGGGNANTEGGFGSPGFGQQATTQASIFGSSGGSFMSPAPSGQAFGSPQQSAFGSPQQAATSPAFGGSPGFGAKPVFGQPSGFGSPTSGGFGSGFGGFNKSPNSSFGAPAAFGSGATFGGGAAFGSASPTKVFGGSPQPTGFGATQSNATFENLATQNTLTFGNLAQQSGQAPQQAPSFNTSPSFTGWRG